MTIPWIENREPASGERNVSSTVVIKFDAVDDVDIDDSATLIFISNVLAYQASAAQNDFAVTATPITKGFHYETVSPGPFPFGAAVDVHVFLRDTLSNPLDTRWSFYVLEDPECFVGPINDFEELLLVPYDYAATTLYYTEQLRLLMLNASMTRPDPIKAVRQVFLRAHQIDLASMLRNIVPTPTLRERTSKLCYKSTAIEVDAALRRKPGLLRACLTELKALKLPQQHYVLLHTYLDTNQPNDATALACVILCLAKALEKNELS